VVAVLVAAAAAIACSATGSYIWIEGVPKTMMGAEDPSILAPGDIIGVRVWNQEANSIDRTRIRDDGKISIPFLNDVEVAGMLPAELARRLEVKLKPFIVNPVVTVVVQERRSVRVSVVGRVAHQGFFDLEHGAGVIHALAAAGGLTPFAHEDGIYVLRNGYWADGDPAPARIRFRYDHLRQGKAPAAAFRLRRGDVVVVE
jgi:polysaccharide export outer membrane protein